MRPSKFQVIGVEQLSGSSDEGSSKRGQPCIFSFHRITIKRTKKKGGGRIKGVRHVWISGIIRLAESTGVLIFTHS